MLLLLGCHLSLEIPILKLEPRLNANFHVKQNVFFFADKPIRDAFKTCTKKR